MPERTTYCKSRNLKDQPRRGERDASSSREELLLHCHALSEIARLINVTAKLDGKMIREKLKRNDGQDRHHAIGSFWHGDDFVSNVLELLRAVPAGERNDGAFTSLDLLHVIEVFREDRIVGRDKNRGKIRANQRDNAVLELGARMTFREKISDLLHFEGPFECDRKIELSPKKKNTVHSGICPGNGFDRTAQIQNLLDLPGQCFERFNDAASLRGGKIPHPAKKQTKQR